jgi:hypothetical protein
MIKTTPIGDLREHEAGGVSEPSDGAVTAG